MAATAPRIATNDLSTNRLPLVWSEGYQIKFCFFDGTTQSAVQTAGTDAGSIQPDVVIDASGNVHLVWIATGGSVRYCKGTFASGAYTFASSTELANVGSYGYATPAIVATGNGKIAAAWSTGTVHLRIWDASASAPSGSVIDLTTGIQADMAASSSTVYIVYSGNFNVNFATVDTATGTPANQTNWSDGGASNHPQIVETGGVAQIYWEGSGQTIWTRRRAADGTLSSSANLEPGVSPTACLSGTQLFQARSYSYAIAGTVAGFTSGTPASFTVGASAVSPTIGGLAPGAVVAWLASGTLTYARISSTGVASAASVVSAGGGVGGGGGGGGGGGSGTGTPVLDISESPYAVGEMQVCVGSQLLHSYDNGATWGVDQTQPGSVALRLAAGSVGGVPTRFVGYDTGKVTSNTSLLITLPAGGAVRGLTLDRRGSRLYIFTDLAVTGGYATYIYDIATDTLTAGPKTGTASNRAIRSAIGDWVYVSTDGALVKWIPSGHVYDIRVMT